MSNNRMRHIGDDQLVFGLPKHMEAVAENGENTYWEIVPSKNACFTCQAMPGKRFAYKPGPAHPNCQCEVWRVVQQVIQPVGPRQIASDTLQGYEDWAFKKFSAGQKITVEIRSLGIFLAGAWIRVDGEEERTTGLMRPGKVLTFEFSKFREPPVPWIVFLMCIGGDNSTISYAIQG